MWKDFFYFSKRERQGLLVLIVFISGIFVGKFLFTSSETTDMIAEEKAEWQNVPETRTDYSRAGNNGGTQNSVHYRKNDNRGAGQTRSDNSGRTYYDNQRKSGDEIPNKINYSQTEKFAEGTVMELNTSDTVQLMKIPGIGASFARRIVAYRNILGGYYRLEQLQEVYGMYEELYVKIVPYLEINVDEITRIPANTASLDKLKAHPYLNFYQAKAIVEMRKKRYLENVGGLSLLEEFTEEDLEKLEHYLAF
jgi:DNA uptake protein ComE-like DNA-binding protein